MNDDNQNPPQLSPAAKAEIKRLEGLGLTSRQALDHLMTNALSGIKPSSLSDFLNGCSPEMKKAYADLRKPRDLYGPYQTIRGKKPE